MNSKAVILFYLLVFFLVMKLNGQSDQAVIKSTALFEEVDKDFPRKEKNLRKWDAPVIADLDQDGHVDILLNDHGLGISVCWNNNGMFAAPYDIIMGDIHGISVGDIDDEGNLEVIMSRGGGSGSNARNSKIFRVHKDRTFTAMPDFEVPLELMRGRTVKFIDGDNDGDLDLLNFAFPDNDRKGESENYIYENNRGNLVLKSTLPAVKTNGQKTLITDYDSDGTLDIVLYGEGAVRLFKGNGDLTYQETSKKALPGKIEHARSIVELDYDNDGDFDLFITRGKEFEIGETFYDPVTQMWGFFTKRGSFKFNDLEVGDILNVINFQSQWPDNDAFFIGETGYDYEFPGETHSGKDMRLVNSDALGYPDQLNKRGTHIGYVGNESWRISGHLWAPATGAVSGVKSYPAFDHPAGYSDVLLENKNGKFVDVTQKNGLFFEIDTEGAAVADLDNNGYADLIIIRRGDLIHENPAMIYMNHGKDGFKLLANHQLVTNDIASIGMAVETIDYNKDGRVDVIIGNERGKWHLFKNKIVNDNQDLTVNVGDSETGASTNLGALVSVSSCGINQIKRIGSTGAAYSLNADNFVHFGLGNCSEKITVTVDWSNGESLKRIIEDASSTIFIGQK